MKEFRTEIKIERAVARMNLKSRILTQGSCFSDAIGYQLRTHKLNALVNPFGVIYNPESIHKAISYSIFNEPVAEHTYLLHNDVHLNYNFHSQYSSLERKALESRLTQTIGATHYFLKDAEWLFLTYGTAWVYRRNDTGEVVANCHKMPSGLFNKSLETVEQIISSFTGFYNALKTLNPRVRVILTVSPVRHLKDTAELNSVSKAVLRLVCHSVANKFADVEYFPAYEIMIDDLRDYRFYTPDQLHPSTEAEEYIWKKFLTRYADNDILDFISKWSEVLSALNHRPFHPHSITHQQFLRQTLKKLEELKSIVDVEEEESHIKNQIV